MTAVSLDGERPAAAASRVDLALCSIQEAQELIEQARQLLSAVPAIGSQRKRLARLSSQLTWAWIAVAATANRRRHCPSSALPEQ